MPGYRGKNVRYVPDHKSFAAFILSDQIRDATDEVAKAVAERAGQLSPRRKSARDDDTTPMADSWHVDREGGAVVVAGNPRVRVFVFNDKQSAAYMEFGTKYVNRHRMLARAAAEFGDFHDHGEGA